MLLDLALWRDHTAHQLLISAIHLEAANIPDDLTASHLAWADCVKPLPAADLPPQLYLELHDYSDPSLTDLPMPDPCPPGSHHTVATSQTAANASQWLQTHHTAGPDHTGGPAED